VLQTDVLQTDVLQTDVLQTDVLQTDVLQAAADALPERRAPGRAGEVPRAEASPKRKAGVAALPESPGAKKKREGKPAGAADAGASVSSGSGPAAAVRPRAPDATAARVVRRGEALVTCTISSEAG
jgi:hypothetical protein